ncbi:MAG: RecX family transcriptional regulator [Thermotogota bacterium]|nr:RecX family transcriptional regulator [Thermotogota bacterium]
MNDHEKLDKALKKAHHYLKYRERSKYEIKKKLRSEGFNDQVIEDVVEKLSEKNILNDNRFTRMYIEDSIRIKKRGPHRVRRELKNLGIEDYLISDALKEFRDDFIETLGVVIENYTPDKRMDEKELLKLKRKLYRKGFSVEDIESEFEKKGLE